MMTATMNDKTTETTAAAKTAAKSKRKTEPHSATTSKKKPGVWTWFVSGIPTSVANLLSAALIRVPTILFQVLLVTMTASSLIPQLGAFLHEQSVGQNNFNLEGEIAVWMVPFVFVVFMITVVEIALMRWIWRRGSRRIERIRRERSEAGVAGASTDLSTGVARTSRSETGKNKKRK